MEVTIETVRVELDKYLKLMNLAHWEITVVYEGVDKDNFATVDSLPAYMRAELAFNLDLLQDITVLRKKIVHELLHMQLGQYTDVANIFAGAKKKILNELEERIVTEIERWPLWEKI